MRTQQQLKHIRGVIEQGGHLAEFLTALRPAEFLRPVPGQEVNVQDLTARMIVSQSTLFAGLDQPTSQRPSSLPDFYAGLGITHHRRDQLAEEIAAHESGPGLAAQFQQAQIELAQRLAESDAPSVVAVAGAALRTSDLLRLVGLDWILHTDDLSRALPGRAPVGRSEDAYADAVRVLAEVLRRRHPGQSVEVRVPPFVAVQCGTPGEPRHTRGTPPTIVECDPTHFLRLCRGRESWDEAVRHGHVRASGVRADISEWLPLC